MRHIPAFFTTLRGTSEEIGNRLAMRLKENESAYAQFQGIVGAGSANTDADASFLDASRFEVFDAYCPGIRTEIESFADTLGIIPQALPFHLFSWLTPGCSQLALQGHLTTHGRPLLIRNYDFTEKLDDMTFVVTERAGSHTHMGTSTLMHGRSDGMNDKGLAISFSACGLPVGNEPYLRKPSFVGPQFWVAIRGILEQCKDVDEALHYLKHHPLASNMNVMAVDASGNILLYETLDGKTAWHLHQDWAQAVNHAVFDDMRKHLPQAFNCSLVREQRINAFMKEFSSDRPVDEKRLNDFFSTAYPEGLDTHFYDEGFGTLRTMIMDPASGSMDICFGSPSANPFERITFTGPYPEKTILVNLPVERAPENFFTLEPIMSPL